MASAVRRWCKGRRRWWIGHCARNSAAILGHSEESMRPPLRFSCLKESRGSLQHSLHIKGEVTLILSGVGTDFLKFVYLCVFANTIYTLDYHLKLLTLDDPIIHERIRE